jgi:hypothetical protein
MQEPPGGHLSLRELADAASTGRGYPVTTTPHGHQTFGPPFTALSHAATFRPDYESPRFSDSHSRIDIRFLSAEEAAQLAEAKRRRRVLKDAFGWGPTELGRLGARDLEAYLELAAHYPNAIIVLQDFNRKPLNPSDTDPAALRELLEAVAGPPISPTAGNSQSGTRVSAKAPKRLPRPSRELDRAQQTVLDACVRLLSEEPDMWHPDGRPNGYQLGKRLGKDSRQFSSDRPIGAALALKCESLWPCRIGTPRPGPR